jgi:hypothetical protein
VNNKYEEFHHWMKEAGLENESEIQTLYHEIREGIKPAALTKKRGGKKRKSRKSRKSKKKSQRFERKRKTLKCILSYRQR